MASNFAVVQEQLDRYIYARDNGHLNFMEKARRCDAFFRGDQWEESVKARLRRQRRPAMTINKILPAMLSIMGEQLRTRADVSYTPGTSGDPEVSAVLDKLWLYIANDNKLDYVESQVFDNGAITGRGFYDVRMNFDHNIYGEVEITSENPLNVMLDPDAEEYDPDKWKEVFVTRWYSENDVLRIHGKEAHAAIKGKTRTSNYMSYDFIDQRQTSFADMPDRVNETESPYARVLRKVERQYRDLEIREHFVDVRTGDMSPIPKDWDRERIQRVLSFAPGVSIIKRPAEIVRWVCTIADELIFNEESPYPDLTIVPFFPIFRSGATIGFVENQIDPQQIFNKTRSQELHIVSSTANSGWKVKRGSLTNMTTEDLAERGAETGLVLELADINDADKIAPNQVPTGLDRLSYLVGEDLKETSLVSDSQRGFDRADVAAKAIMAKKASGSSNQAKPLDNLMFSRTLLARAVLRRVQQFFTEERTYRITRGGLQPTHEVVSINQPTPEGTVLNDVTVGEYNANVIAVPARNDFEETQFEEARGLRELGVQIPDHVLIEHSHLNRKRELAEEIKRRTGWGEQTEIDKQALLLEQQVKQLEAAKMGAEKQKIESEAALNLIRAQKTAEEDPNKDGGIEAEMRKLELDRQRMAMEMQLKKYEIDQELQLKRQELELKRQEMMQNVLLKKAEAAARLQDQRKKDEEAAKAAKSKETR